MQELQNAQLLLISSLPAQGQWQGPAATTFEASVWELIAELQAVKDSLWI